jgi:hypothetical protein
MRAEGARKRAAEGPVRPKERRRKQNGRLWWSHATVAYHRAIGINVDLRLVDVAAFRAPQGPVLKAGTVLDRHAGLASGTPRALGGARRQFGRRVQIGHGIDPKQVTNGDYLKPGSGAVVPAVL